MSFLVNGRIVGRSLVSARLVDLIMERLGIQGGGKGSPVVAEIGRSGLILDGSLRKAIVRYVVCETIARCGLGRPNCVAHTEGIVLRVEMSTRRGNT